MQNGFIFLLIIWNSSPFSSEHSATNHLQFSLGCQAVIPCQDYRSDLNSLTWNYKKDEHHQPIQIYFQDKNGVQRHQQLFRSRMKVSRNGSLVIDHFTEDDQGLYSCEKPYSDTVITVKKEILKETGKTVYVIAGTDFTHVCPGELANLKWTFKASNMTTESDFVTSNKSIHIVNVKRADAGKYTCWKSGCNRHMQKLLTINLCVITVHHSDDSFVSCTVMCDMEFSNIKPNSTLYVETGTRTISVLVDTNGINCSAKQMSDGCSSGNSTHGPSNTLNITTDIPTELEYLIPVVYGTSAALTCLILMALLIYHLRQRLWAAFPVHLCCWGLNSRVEEETSVVYSSVVIRKPAKTTNNRMSCDSSCVYSEIKVQRTIP
ncbi:uncharacterized protein LOC120563141 isoform X1 [Perca fluviatilis]|uniref:uncharacterized protein LOC120563141 isoform X1 n=2 Tax=Perca fluviatilis TaxID=8168 RepID=UPI001966166A|nr:uncharacterized protein LOC120563141 isoform X1 [Perca fluviatilis]